MESVLQNLVPQAGILNKEENPAIDSDRVKASVVDAVSTDFGGSQKHDVANQADAEEVDRLAPTASKKTSEEEEDNHTSAEAVAFRALRTKVESGGFYIRQEESSYETEEHGKVHHQSTYGTSQVTTEPRAQENCQLQ